MTSLNDTIRAVFLAHGFTIKDGQTDLKPYVYEAVHALLSKLRAPVADERATFEAKFPMPAQCTWTGNGYAATGYNGWDAHKHANRFEGWQARAALASAPVADEHYDEVKATLLGAHRIMEGIAAIERRAGPIGSHARGYTHKITAALRHLDALASAPVAGEAQLPWHLPVQHWTDEEKAKLVAAPQASEAEQTIIAAFLERSGQWLTNDAIVKAARDAVLEEAAKVAESTAAGDASPDNPYRSGTAKQAAARIRALKSQSAALSAQPGAQRTGGSDA